LPVNAILAMAEISQPSRSTYPGNGFMSAIEQAKVMSRHRMRDQARKAS
jgi:hypothetical protein